MEIPAVSVIIPLYNAEKYIGELLESILAQTFQNFEVIVVNNCSTDSSCAVVESYAEKFSGRLALSHMEYNTGNGGLPRNKGMMLSRGEYIFLMDADDLITKTALEERYTLAKEYDADVVYCEDNYRMQADGSGIHKEIAKRDDLVEIPTFETNNLAERVKRILQGKYGVMPWRKLVRRSLIFEYEIFFPHVTISEDDICTYGLVFYAKKFLRVPNLTYYRRLSENSIMRKKKTPQQTVNFWLNPILLGLKALDKFTSRHEFFKNNPQYRYAVLENFVNGKFGCILNDSFKIQPFEVYDTIKREFGEKFGENDVLISMLCTAVNTQQKINAMNAQRFNQFAVQAQQQTQKFNQFAAQAQRRIVELEAEVNRLKNKE